MRLGWSLFALLTACGKLASEPQDASAPSTSCTVTAPQLLATTAGSSGMIGDFLVHGPNVFWNTKDGLWSMPKGGGVAVNLTPCAIFGFVVDGDAAFCFAGTAWDELPLPLVRVPLDGSQIQTLAPPDPSIGAIVGASGGLIYTQASIGSIETVDELTAKVTPMVSSPSLVTFLAIDDGLLYWSSTLNPSSNTPTTTLNVTSATGETMPLATLNGFASRLVKNASSIFVAGYHYEGQFDKVVFDVYRVPPGGGTPMPFVTDLRGDALAVDDSTLYVETMSDGARAFPLDGGLPAATNIGSLRNIASMALDDGFIYWLTLDADRGSSLFRVCR